MDRNHTDPDTINLNASRHAKYMHKAWKKHQNTVYWVDIDLALKKGLKFYQTRSNAVILHETLPACVYSESCLDGKLEKSYARKNMRHVVLLQRSPWNITWMKELGSEVAQRPDGQVVQQFQNFQLNQPNPNPDHDRTGQPVVGFDPRTASGGRKTSHSQQIETRSFHEEAVKTW